MSAFSSRTAGYRSGVYILFVAFLVFTVGFSAPFWSSQSSSHISVHTGPWMMCYRILVNSVLTAGCSTYGLNIAGWLHAVRTLEALAFAFLLISCVLTLATNCCRTVPPRKSRVPESFACTGGTLGLVGVIIYGHNDENTDWALYLAGIGSALATIASIVITVNNQETSQSNAGVVVGMTSFLVSQTEHPGGHINPGYNPGLNPDHNHGYSLGAPVQPGIAY